MQISVAGAGGGAVVNGGSRSLDPQTLLTRRPEISRDVRYSKLWIAYQDHYHDESNHETFEQQGLCRIEIFLDKNFNADLSRVCALMVVQPKSNYRRSPAPLALFLACPLLPFNVFAQLPSGNDISTAIPIVLGQTINDIGDSSLSPNRVFKITLARGQAISAVLSVPRGNIFGKIDLLAPSTRSIATLTSNQILSCSGGSNCFSANNSGFDFTYQVPQEGVYFIRVFFGSGGNSYNLRVTATGTPIAVANPASAGCLSGRVDSITYSLHFIAMGLPDEVTIGGTRACASCTVKPPLYAEISSRLEETQRTGGSVEACYDSSGNIFQLKLLRP